MGLEFLNRKAVPFWDQKKKLYDLADCPCGGTQDGGQVKAGYFGIGTGSGWHIYCTQCGRYTESVDEMEAVRKWNEGKVAWPIP